MDLKYEELIYIYIISILYIYDIMGMFHRILPDSYDLSLSTGGIPSSGHRWENATNRWI